MKWEEELGKHLVFVKFEHRADYLRLKAFIAEQISKAREEQKREVLEEVKKLAVPYESGDDQGYGWLDCRERVIFLLTPNEKPYEKYDLEDDGCPLGHFKGCTNAPLSNEKPISK